MCALENIVKGITPEPPRIILYGTRGIGKSTQANIPGAVFIPCEDGLNEINCQRFPVAKTWVEFTNNLTSLISEDHKYKSVVIDTLDWAEKLCFEHVCNINGVDNILGISFGKGYKQAENLLEKVIKALDTLRKEKRMTIIIVAHSELASIQDPQTDPYDKHAMKVRKTTRAMFEEWCDCLLFASYKMAIKKSGENFGTDIVRPIGSGERCIYTQERPSFFAKNRYNLPLQMDFDLQKIIKQCSTNLIKLQKSNLVELKNNKKQ